MTLVLAFVITGAFAQPFEDANYSEDYTTDMYQTVGKSFGLYVIPDPNYSPLYAGAGTIGTGVQWTWTLPAGLGPNVGGIVSGTPIAQNYVEFSNPATTGSYNVIVAESNTAGSCAGGAITQVVNIISAPTAALTATPADADWGELVAGLEYQRCTEIAGDNLTVTFTETGVPAAMANYAYGIQVVRTAYEADGVTPIPAAASTTTVINYDTDAKVAGGADDGGSVEEDCGIALEWYDDAGTDRRTKYEFTLIKASDAPLAALDGVISQISHKSDYIDGTVTTYAFAGNTVTYWVNLPPVTGPIYHIPNNYTF